MNEYVLHKLNFIFLYNIDFILMKNAYFNLLEKKVNIKNDFSWR